MLRFAAIAQSVCGHRTLPVQRMCHAAPDSLLRGSPEWRNRREIGCQLCVRQICSFEC